MNHASGHCFSREITVFHERRLPEPAAPAGYAALIDAYGLRVPLPRALCATGSRHRILDRDGWRIYSPRHTPPPTLEGHLRFALKYEGLDLAVLKRLFLKIKAEPIERIVRNTPTGGYARRIWFLYEWLTSRRLDLPNAARGAYAPVVDPKLQYGRGAETSSRHKVKNNLPGTPAFCPLVYRTEALQRFQSLGLETAAQEAAAAVPRDLMARTAAFLLLKDSKASFSIESQGGAHDRIQRWGRALGEAGRRALDAEELDRLQRIVIGDDRFVHLGLRSEGGFVGEHDRTTGIPLPDHINARPEDLPGLVGGMIAFDQRAGGTLDAVLEAASLAFGFVYVHPYEDGNGRLHRYLIHHVLARRGFAPPGMVFPVSAAILARISDYRTSLEDYSRRLLPAVSWEPTETGNVRVLGDTGDFYRFFDATKQAEFLYGCVQRTIEVDLPEEADFLRRADAFRAELRRIVDMPTRLAELLFRFLDQNKGKLSQRGREKEFAALTAGEIRRIEKAYQEFFGDHAQKPQAKKSLSTRYY